MNLVVFDIGGTSVKYGRYQVGGIDKKSSFATPKTWEEMKENLHQVVKDLSDKDTKGVAMQALEPLTRKKVSLKALVRFHIYTVSRLLMSLKLYLICL